MWGKSQIKRIARQLSLLCLSVCLWACQPSMQPSAQPDYNWSLPEGFPAPLVPSDNPMTQAKVSLGERLFFDNGLSFNNSMSCASCHQPEFAFAEPRQFALGASGEALRRNTQGLMNVAYHSELTWAHSALNSIEQQLLIPMFAEDPIELGITGYEDLVLKRFQQAPYKTMFTEAFGDSEISFLRIVQALASYVRSLISFNSAFDRYAYFADDNALAADALRGMELFFSERLECFHCHGGLNFTQASQHQNQRLVLRAFHNTGLYNTDGQGTYPDQDQGLIEVTLLPDDMGHFRAPSLRNVAITAPYMHDGSIATLSQVIDFYAAGGRGEGATNPLKSPFVKGFNLSDSEKSDLLAFLHSLTDKQFLAAPNKPQD